MRTHVANETRDQSDVIPLLDASWLPADDDWALLESMNPRGSGIDFEPDADRLGRFNVTASYDE